MEKVDSDIIIPPRLLAGMTVMFWGGMVGMATTALVVAILLEGKHWLRLRWKGTPRSHVRAFQLSLLLMALVLGWVWLNDDQVKNLFIFVSLAPIWALPVELAQRYGGKDRMYLNTFFYFSRQRMRKDIIEGREINPSTINTGYPYILLTLFAATCSETISIWAMLGFALIVLVSVISISRKRGMSWGRLAFAAPIFLVCAFFINTAMVAVHKKYSEKSGQKHMNSNPGRGMNVNFSRLGGLGDIKQSKEIHWRMVADDAPEYLAISIYNSNHGSTWSYNYEDDGFRDSDSAFLSGVPIQVGELFSFADLSTDENIEDKSRRLKKRATIRGGVASSKDSGVVPMFNGYGAVSDLNDAKTQAYRNPMGSLLLDDRTPVVKYTLWEEKDFKREVEKPNMALDTELPVDVRAITRQLSNEIQLSAIPHPKAKIAAIRHFFETHFTYSTHFESRARSYEEYLESFMLDERKGHCEYFATTTALLLREQGVPARYCVGYVVSEQDGEEWVMRGTHAHAWCRVWIDGKWEDVDLTPPDWLTADIGNEDVDIWQKIRDTFGKWKDDFFLWRTQEANKQKMMVWLIVGGALVLAWIVFRLWQKKVWVKGESEKGRVTFKNAQLTPLNALEQKLEKIIGVRPVGMPFAVWMEKWFETLNYDTAAEWKEALEMHLNLKYGSKDEVLEELNLKISSIKNTI